MQKYLLSVRTLAAAATVIAASMTFVVAVMSAAEIQPDFEFACQIFFSSSAYIAGRSADDFDIDIVQCGDRTAADTAANNDVNIFGSQQCRQCPVAGIAAFKNFFVGYQIIFGSKQCKSRSMPEMLENFVVFASNSYNHFFKTSLSNNAFLTI